MQFRYNIKLAVSTQWNIGNMKSVLEFAKKEGLQVEEVE